MTANNTAIVTSSILNRMDSTALDALFNAQLDDLVERRSVQDKELFKECLAWVAPEDHTIVAQILDFTDNAGDAFKEYHRRRAAAKAADTADTADAVKADESAVDAADAANTR